MLESYHTGDRPVNVLPTPVRHTLELILRLTRRHGFCFAHNAWFAHTLDCTERTVSRHVKVLVDAGMITCRRVGNERFIWPGSPPKVEAESSPCLPASCTGETQATDNSNASSVKVEADPVVVSAILGDDHPETATTDSTHETPLNGAKLTADGSKLAEKGTNRAKKAGDHPETSKVLDHLIAEGIDARTAETLATDPAECRRQLEALGRLKGIENRAGWLRMAILGRWRHEKGAKPLATDSGMYEEFKRERMPDPATMEGPPHEMIAACRAKTSLARASAAYQSG